MYGLFQRAIGCASTTKTARFLLNRTRSLLLEPSTRTSSTRWNNNHPLRRHQVFDAVSKKNLWPTTNSSQLQSSLCLFLERDRSRLRRASINIQDAKCWVFASMSSISANAFSTSLAAVTLESGSTSSFSVPLVHAFVQEAATEKLGVARSNIRPSTTNPPSNLQETQQETVKQGNRQETKHETAKQGNRQEAKKETAKQGNRQEAKKENPQEIAKQETTRQGNPQETKQETTSQGNRQENTKNRNPPKEDATLEESEQKDWLSLLAPYYATATGFSFRMIKRITNLLFLFEPVWHMAPLALVSSSANELWWMNLRYAINLAGPTCIKWAQWATTRPDLFSPSVLAFLSSFHSHCPTHSFHETRKIIEANFGVGAIDHLFTEFRHKPIASGAIAQVHKATLKNGTQVAVKVRHPDSYHSILVDLSIMNFFASAIESIPAFEILALKDATLQFSQNMLAQLSMQQEAKNLARFHTNFENDPHIVFPRPIDYLNRFDDMLFETWEEGTPVAWYFTNGSKATNKRIAQYGLNAFLKMMLVDNFMHADLHPGNVFIREEDSGLKLVFLDVGLTNALTKREIWLFVELFQSVVEGNGEYGSELMAKYARVPPKFKTAEDEQRFKDNMGALFNQLKNVKLSEVEVGKFLSEMITIAREHGVKLEGAFSTLVVGTLILEGIGRQLDPSINLITNSIPYLIKVRATQPHNLPVLAPETTNRVIKRVVTDEISDWWNWLRKKRE